MGNWWDDKTYSESSDEYSDDSTTAPPAATTPAMNNQEVVTLYAVTILHSYANGDLLVEMEETTTRICSPTPLPTAVTTVHKETDPSAQSAASKYSATVSSTTTSYDASGWPETESPYPTSAVSSGTPTGYGFASSTSSPPPHQEQSMGPDKDDHPFHPPIGAMVAVPLVVIGALIVGFFVWRRKRQQRRARASNTQEMKMRGPEEGLPQYTAAPLMAPAAALSASTPASSSLSPVTTGPAPSTAGATAGSDPQPVILNNNIGGAYLTGIDTSDAVSMVSGPPNSRMSLDARSMTSTDDPPPPYRPRSVPPISRETSLRVPNTVTTIPAPLAPLSESNLSRVRLDEATGLTNPFADPESDDDDFASEASTPINSPLIGRGQGPQGGGSAGYPSIPGRTNTGL